MNVLWLIWITAFLHLALRSQELFSDVGTKGGFFVAELISEQLFSLSFISTKGELCPPPTLCQCVNIISDIDTDQSVCMCGCGCEVIRFSQLWVMICYHLGGNTGNHLPAVSSHLYHYYFNFKFSRWNKLANGLLSMIYISLVGNIRAEQTANTSADYKFLF